MKICFSNLGITKMYRIWGVRAGSCWLLASSFWRNLGRWELKWEASCPTLAGRNQQPLLVFQRDHVLVGLAESGDALQSAFGLRHKPDRPKAVNRVAVFREVPLASLARGTLGSAAIDGRLGRWKAVRAVQRS